jgi:hypothetical protein
MGNISAIFKGEMITAHAGKQLALRENLFSGVKSCYHASTKQFGCKKINLLELKLMKRGFSEPVFNCGGQGCCIFSCERIYEGPIYLP